MASEIRVNKIENRSGLGTVTFADTGVDLAGIVTATTFSGSGASLTSLPAANITGTLPAISAANLTNVPAANITGTLPAISAANLTNIPAANVTGTLPALTAANLTNIPAANLVGVCTSGLTKTGGFGKVVQVVQTVKTDVSSWSFTTSDAAFQETGLQATITPTNASNIILIWCSGMYGGSRNGENYYWTISRSSDGNYFSVGDTSSSRTRVTTGSFLDSTSRPAQFSCFAVDTNHNTTSANTYKLLANGNNQTGTGYLNRTSSDDDGFYRPRGTSTLILQEIEV